MLTALGRNTFARHDHSAGTYRRNLRSYLQIEHKKASLKLKLHKNEDVITDDTINKCDTVKETQLLNMIHLDDMIHKDDLIIQDFLL